MICNSEIRDQGTLHIVTVAETEVCGAGDNVAVTAAFITGAKAFTIELMLPPPEQSAGVSTSH